MQLKSDALIASGSDALFDAVITPGHPRLGPHHAMVGSIARRHLGALISWPVSRPASTCLLSLSTKLLGVSIPAELTSANQARGVGLGGRAWVYDLILHNYGPDVKIGSLHINVLDTMTAYEIHASLPGKISNHMIFDNHGIIMTVGAGVALYGENRRAKLQTKVLQTLTAHTIVEKVSSIPVSPDRLLLRRCRS